MGMSAFLKQYYAMCKRVTAQYGFVRKNKMFYRLSNDVLQTFSVEKLGQYSFGQEYRIGFSVTPLCQPLDVRWMKYGCGPYYLKRFKGRVDCWCCTEKNVNECMEEIEQCILKDLLPLFERANSCDTALPALVELEQRFGPGQVMHDERKYYIALKKGDWDFALASRQALYLQHYNSYCSGVKNGWLTEEARMSREEELRHLQEEIERLERREVEYFRDEVEKNEKKAAEILKAYFIQI